MVIMNQGMASFFRTAGLTFAGAFTGSLALTQIPTNWTQAKVVILPALGAAVGAEIVFLRTTIAKLLASNPATSDTEEGGARGSIQQ